MMWFEAAVSSMLLISALWLSLAAPPQPNPLPDLHAYRLAQDSAVVCAEGIRAGAPSAVSECIRAASSGTPHCVAFVPSPHDSDSAFASGFQSLISCSGSPPSEFHPASLQHSGEVSIVYALWHEGQLLKFKIRQWSNENR